MTLSGSVDSEPAREKTVAIARQTVASLTSQDPTSGEIVPWLAEKFESNGDATSFTFTLRTGATFADGTAIDAASVKTNFEAIKALGAKASLGSTYLSDVSAITVKDPQTVVVDFSKPNAQFLQATFHLLLLQYVQAEVLPCLYRVVLPINGTAMVLQYQALLPPHFQQRRQVHTRQI